MLASLHDPRLRHLPLSTRGLSQARNAGLEASRAEIVAFTDDDCQPTPDWLADLQAVFAGGEADMVFGPVVAPAGYDPGTGFCPTHPVERVQRYTWQALAADQGVGIGANMSLRRRAFEVVGPFDTTLGAGSPLIPSGEETDYQLRVLAHGLYLLSAPIASVVHTYGVRPGEAGKRLQQQGNFAVGAVHEKLLLAPYGAGARSYLKQLYGRLFRQVLLNLLRGRRRHLGLNRLRAMLAGRAYVRRRFDVSDEGLLVPRSQVIRLSA